jgi:hypothetical protein
LGLAACTTFAICLPIEYLPTPPARNGRVTGERWGNRRSLHYSPPDLPAKPGSVASLKEGAHAAWSSARSGGICGFPPFW